MRQIDFGQVANSYASSREDIPVALFHMNVMSAY
jgi:hypothetical protein